jgi:exonuclease III
VKLISVYGLVQLDLKSNFLSELVRVCSKEALPIVIGGDFNIVRSLDEKKITTTIMIDGLSYLMPSLTH